MFSSWWSKGSAGSFSCELGQEVKLNGLVLGAGSFSQLHSGTQKNPQTQNVSIFVSNDQFSAASSAIKKLKTLRHPSIINYIDSQESEKAILLATEQITPLLLHLNLEVDENFEQKDAYLAWGVFQIFRGVAFLHEANLVHGSLHAGSIFVTPAGEWKIFGLEQMRSTVQPNQPSEPRSPKLSRYNPPELKNAG